MLPAPGVHLQVRIGFEPSDLNQRPPIANPESLFSPSVLARGVIFVDLALAQVAALGITVAFLAGHPIQSEAAYWYALAFTVGAPSFSL